MKTRDTRQCLNEVMASKLISGILFEGVIFKLMSSVPPSAEEVQMFLQGWMSSQKPLMLSIFREDATILGLLRATISSVSTDMLRISIGEDGWMNIDLRDLSTGFIMSDRLPSGEIFDLFKPSTEFFLVLRRGDILLAFIEPREEDI